MKKFLLGTNWKMHKTEQEAITYTKLLKDIVLKHTTFQFFIIPPFTDLKEVKKISEGCSLIVGAQNMHWEDEGAFTGEISPKMLKEIGIRLIELGHSERRQYYNENNFELNKKLKAAIKYGFTPLLCIGEHMTDKEYGVTEEVLSQQIKIGLHGVSSEDAKKVWIAYEPVWAIGENGVPADAHYVDEVHTTIRSILIKCYGEETAYKVPILYGGSVNKDNAFEFSKLKDVDGLFIGRSAWEIEKFKTIIDLLES